MVIPIVPLIVLIILVALALWVIRELVTNPMLHKVFVVVLVVVVVLGLLQIFGLLGGGPIIIK